MKRKKRTFILILLCIVLYKCVINIVPFQLDPAEEEFANVKLCPACYGQNLCPHFFNRNLQLTGGNRLRVFKLLNSKNVYFGKLERKVVIKKLAHDSELQEGDRILCELANLVKGCKVRTAIRYLASLPKTTSSKALISIVRKLNISNDITHCLSERLLQLIYERIIVPKIAQKDNKVLPQDSFSEVIYTILINPEPLFLQIFPQSEGWPFPEYIGSCGRAVVEEYIGLPLSEFEDSPWIKRLNLSYQLLQLAHQLTMNSMDFALYMTDVNMHNFAVRSDGKLFLVDVENIITVDKRKVRADKPQGWNKPHRNKGEACWDCLSFSVEDLCSHELADHNYYAICKGILVPDSYYSSKGLLHGIPHAIDKETNLTALLKSCSDPSSDYERFVTVPKLLKIMHSLL